MQMKGAGRGMDKRRNVTARGLDEAYFLACTARRNGPRPR